VSKSTDVLKRVLGSLSIKDISELNRVAVRKEYPADTVVCIEGELAHTFYVIETGLVSVSRRLGDDSEQVLGILRDGQFFGEMGLLDDVPRAATIRTLTKSTLVELSEETFDAVVERNPGVAVALLRGITRSLRDTDKLAMSELELRNEQLAQTLVELQEAQSELLAQERLKRDIEIAASVQRSILPSKFPVIDGFEFGVYARPAREVGGDFYDVIPIDDENFALVVADISGKSVQAAIFMAIVRALLLREAAEHLSPADTVHRLQDQLLKTSTAEMFVTMFYGVVNKKTRKMSFVRAGHERPIFYRAATRSLELLDPPGRFIGMLPDLVVEEASLDLHSGDCLIFYSDGVPDAENADGQFFTMDRLIAVSHAAAGNSQSAQAVADKILRAVDHFRGETEQTDDITILTAKII